MFHFSISRCVRCSLLPTGNAFRDRCMKALLRSGGGFLSKCSKRHPMKCVWGATRFFRSSQSRDPKLSHSGHGSPSLQSDPTNTRVLVTMFSGGPSSTPAPACGSRSCSCSVPRRSVGSCFDLTVVSCSACSGSDCSHSGSDACSVFSCYVGVRSVRSDCRCSGSVAASTAFAARSVSPIDSEWPLRCAPLLPRSAVDRNAFCSPPPCCATAGRNC